jgi:phosphohistidine phosphatase
MKKLILIRHGRAEEQSHEISDFERSLTSKGKIICGLIARKLKEVEKSAGLIITSPAFRALETAIIFAEAFGIDPDQIKMNSNFYYKMNYNYLSELLFSISDETDTLTIFGHNPSFSDIADKLCKGGCDFLPKSGVVGISFNIISWPDIQPATGKLEYFLKPEKIL